MITAQYAKQRKFIYYRCSKKNGKCNQAYVNNTDMIKQLKDKLESIAIPENWAVILLAEIDRMEKQNVQKQRSFSENLEIQISEIDKKLDKLVNSFLDGLIEKNTYVRKKDELLRHKTDLEEQLKDFREKGDAWVELTRDWVEVARQAGKLALSNDFSEIKQTVKKIGSNRRVMDKKVLLDVVPPFAFVSAYRSGRGLWPDCGEPGGGKKEQDTDQKMEDVLSCRGGRI